MTLAELVDTMLERGMSLEIRTDSRELTLRFQALDQSGNRLGLVRSIHRRYLDAFEDQQYKEELLENEIEKCIAEFH